jgi:CHAD domain-containing protein
MERRSMQPTTFDATDWSIDAFRALLGDRLLVPRPTTAQVTFLDTFDWRLHAAGARLTSEREGRSRSLHWSTADAPPYVLPIDAVPRFAADLPSGFLRDRLEPLIEVRRLLELGSCRVDRCPMRLLDDAGNILVRLDLTEVTILDGGGDACDGPRRQLAVEPVPDQDEAAESLVRRLAEAGLTVASPPDLLAATAAVLGRVPGDYSSKPRIDLRPDQPAEEALRALLHQLLDTLTANVVGVLDDLDIEFLHDLRVATRRTRSALSQLKNVLPAGPVKDFAAEFKWLGGVTGPLRDMDVYLLEMAQHRQQLDAPDDVLGPLDQLLRRTRRNQLRRVRRALRSARFERLVTGWAAFLENPGGAEDEPAEAATPILEIANRRILKAYRRMLKRGKKLQSEPPPELLHRLRIDAKKLRYLLEFFRELYDPSLIATLVKELKKLQDILGGFNDMEVQQRRLREFADRMIEEQSAAAATIFAMGRLADVMRERQESYRLQFHDRFEAFASKNSRRLYDRLFGARKP